VNFARGKIPSGATAYENVYIVYQSRRRPNVHRTVWLASGERRRYSNDANTRNLLKFAGVPQTNKPMSAVSSPYCEDMCRSCCCLTSCFPIVDTCLSCEGIAGQSCAMVRRRRIFGDLCILYFQRAACSTFQTCLLNSH